MAKSSAQRSVNIAPGDTDRSIIIGHTGSGKSELARWMLRRLPTSPSVIYDVKPDPSFLQLPGAALAETWDAVMSLADDGETDYIVFRPPADELSDANALDEYLWNHLQSLSGVPAYIDELYAFHNHGRAGKGLTALLTRGRGMNIPTIMATQRPAFVSLFSLTEAQNFYIFRLLHDDDLKRVAKIIPGFDRITDPQDFGFYYWNIRDRLLQEMAPVTLETKPLAKNPKKDNTAPSIAAPGLGLRWI